MSGAARVDPEAIRVVATALVRYGESEQAAVAAADSAVRRAAAEVASALSAREHEVQHARAVLKACQSVEESRDCSGAAAALARAQQRLDQARQARTLVERAEVQFAARKARHLATVATLVEGGRAQLGRNATNLAAFLTDGSRGSGGSGGSVGGGGVAGGPSGSGGGAHVPPGFPDGFAMVPLALVDDGADAVTDRSEFGKGYSPEDLRWAHEAFQEVVLPALALGKGEDYFRQRDVQEGRMGTRSYADTHAGFLKDGSAVKLDAVDGRFEVKNGRHRIAVARAMGLSEIPARLR